MDWIALQLADAAFPAGGFAHSGGMEAAVQLAWLGPESLEPFVHDAIWQAGFGSLPLVGQVARAPGRLAEVDAVCDAFLTGVVTNRASRTQGRAFVSACARSFDDPDLARLHDQVRGKLLAGHHAPLFGAVTAALGVARGDALRLWMHGTLRNLLAAAVRLGIVGTHEAQSLQRAAAPLLDRVLERCGDLGCDAIAQTAPRLEIVASQHDHLYSRLFQS
jgi:urease accessory protein